VVLFILHPFTHFRFPSEVCPRAYTVAMLFLAAAWLGLVSSAIAIPIDMVTLPDVKPAFTVEQATDYYLYNVTMDAFVAARIVRSGTDLSLNWTSNGCSVAPNDPFGFDCECLKL
jgi:hypothetical protein